MLPKRQNPQNQGYLFTYTLLCDLCDHRHPLYILANQIDWAALGEKLEPLFCGNNGTPAKPTRLIIALLYLKYTEDLSDEKTILTWLENPYWQYFSGETTFQHEFPIDPSTLTRWRKRIGSEKLMPLLDETIRLAREMKAISKKDLSRITVDSTVQEKNITFPTDAKLLRKGILKCAQYAKHCGIRLRQNYLRKSKISSIRAGKYAHAKQWNRRDREIQNMKNWLGRVIRDIKRKVPEDKMPEFLKHHLELCERVRTQTRYSKDKIYSYHEEDVKCIGKGKAKNPYEFGQVATFGVTNKGGWVVTALIFKGNPHDSKTLSTTVSSVESNTGVPVKEICVDKGYRGHDYKGSAKVFISGSSNAKLTISEKKRKKRRSAIEPVIGHMKREHRLGRCFLKGLIGDEVNVVLAAAGRNMRKLLKLIALGKIFPSFFRQFPNVYLCIRSYFGALQRWNTCHFDKIATESV